MRKKDDGTERTIPQIRKEGELTDSVRLLVEDNPTVEVLEGLTVIQHRLKIFEGFVECERDGYVKAEIDGLTNTLRFKHKKPLVNLPGVDRPWGKEIRGCLTAPQGYVLCGADMTSLEDTCKRHYMHPYDPDYVLEMSQDGFDPHLDLAKHAGAVSQDDIDAYNQGNKPELKALRKNYKVVNYSATYGVGAAKLSRTTGLPAHECQALLEAYWDRNWSVKKFAESQHIRKLMVRCGYRTLSVSSGTAYATRRMCSLHSTNQLVLTALTSGLPTTVHVEANIIGQFHDESINLVKEGDQDVHSNTLTWAIEKLNKELKLNVDLGIDIQYGQRYSDVH